MKTVGIGMTCYNRDRYLQEAIGSVLCQTFADWRLVIVDDGSDDDSLAIAKQSARSDNRITLISNKRNQGAGYALSQAIAQLKDCDYVCWVDSDDLIDPNAIELCLNYLEDYPADMVYTHYRQIDSKGEQRGLGSRCKIPYSSNSLLTMFMVFHFRLMRTDAYFGCGGIDPTIPAAIDYDFCLRFDETYTIRCLPEVLYSYRKHGGSMSICNEELQATHARLAIERAIVRRGLNKRIVVDRLFRLEEVA